MKIAIDIETLPTKNQDVISDLESTIVAPAQYKKPESIADWMRENKESALREKVAKTSFDGLYGSIACIAWSTWDGEYHAADSRKGEYAMLKEFMDRISNSLKMQLAHGGEMNVEPVFIGHNIAGFDMPFLKHRCIIHGIRPIASLEKAFSAKPWDGCINDTMLMWSTDREKRVSLDKLCKALGIRGKDGFDGSMVAETWPQDPEKVIQYCKDDVRRVVEVHDRLTFQTFPS